MNNNTQVIFRTKGQNRLLEFPPFFREFYTSVKDRIHKSAYESYVGDKDEKEVLKQMFVESMRKMYELLEAPEKYTLDLAPSALTEEEKARNIDFAWEVVELNF